MALTTALEELTRAVANAPAAPDPGCDALVARFLPNGPSDDVALLWLRLHPSAVPGLDILGPGDEPTPAESSGVPADDRGLVVSAEPRSVPVCRRYLRERLTGAPPPLIDNAELCVSELVTNAVLHAGTDIEVRVEQALDACRLEVRDANPVPPLRHHHTEGATTGRGLEMVSGVARTWGSPRWTGAGRRSGAR